MFEVILKRLKHCLFFSLIFPEFPIPIPKVSVSTLGKLLDKINQEFKTIGIYSFELDPEHLLLCVYEFFVDKLHLARADARNLGDVVNIAIRAHWLQIERNISQKELNTNEVLVLYA